MAVSYLDLSKRKPYLFVSFRGENSLSFFREKNHRGLPDGWGFRVRVFVDLFVGWIRVLAINGFQTSPNR